MLLNETHLHENILTEGNVDANTIKNDFTNNGFFELYSFITSSNCR